MVEDDVARICHHAYPVLQPTAYEASSIEVQGSRQQQGKAEKS